MNKEFNESTSLNNIDVSKLGVIFRVEDEYIDMEFSNIEQAFQFFRRYEYYTHKKKDVNELTLEQFTEIVKKAFVDGEEVALYSDVDLHCCYYGCFKVVKL